MTAEAAAAPPKAASVLGIEVSAYHHAANRRTLGSAQAYGADRESLAKLLDDHDAYFRFLDLANRKFASENALFYKRVTLLHNMVTALRRKSAFRQLGTLPPEVVQEMHSIYGEFVAEDAENQLNLTMGVRKKIEEEFAEAGEGQQPSAIVFEKARAEIFEVMYTGLYPKYLKEELHRVVANMRMEADPEAAETLATADSARPIRSLFRKMSVRR